MSSIKVKVKDQFEAENTAIALVRAENEHHIPLSKRIEHIEVEGDILLPNMEFLYENPKNGRIYKFIEVLEAH